MISTSFMRPWEIRFPTVTRFLDTTYVDEFLTEGKLRLSSFKKFRENPDEQQGDIFEGRAAMQIETPNGSHAISVMNGQEAYVLCGGTVEHKGMKASFKTDDGFRISNTLAFADAVSRHIPGFIAGMEGLCSYRESLLIEEFDESPIKPPDSFPNPESWSHEYDRYVAEKAKRTFFIKQLRFSNQGEYRFIWFTSGNSEKEFIDIVCPEAIKFCQRLP